MALKYLLQKEAVFLYFISRLQTNLELPSPKPLETAQSFSSKDNGKAEKEAYNSGKAATEIQG